MPDDIFSDFVLQETDKALHESIFLLAFKNRCLGKLISPFHRYLIENGSPRVSLTNQYRRDLKEDWMKTKDEVTRHRKNREYQGKLFELHCAEWLENQGWHIENLEALGAESDIEARSPDNVDCAIEIKYIGMPDNIFSANVNSLNNMDGGISYTFPPKEISNYILLRTFEAATQLKRNQKERIVFLIMDAHYWCYAQFVFKENYINWKCPDFLNGGEELKKWFKKENRYSNIEEDIKQISNMIDNLWVIVVHDCFQFSKKHIINLKNG